MTGRPEMGRCLVAISGSTVVVGAYGFDSGLGGVFRLAVLTRARCRRR
jgi:hypothetical protein